MREKKDEKKFYKLNSYSIEQSIKIKIMKYKNKTENKAK